MATSTRSPVFEAIEWSWSAAAKIASRLPVSAISSNAHARNQATSLIVHLYHHADKPGLRMRERVARIRALLPAEGGRIVTQAFEIIAVYTLPTTWGL